MMASGSTQDDSGGADYTEAVLTLQKTVQKFQHDAEDGRADFVIAAINDVCSLKASMQSVWLCLLTVSGFDQ